MKRTISLVLMLIPCSICKRSKVRVNIVAFLCESSKSYAKRRVRSPYCVVCVCVRAYGVERYRPALIATPRGALTFAGSVSVSFNPSASKSGSQLSP